MSLRYTPSGNQQANATHLHKPLCCALSCPSPLGTSACIHHIDLPECCWEESFTAKTIRMAEAMA